MAPPQHPARSAFPGAPVPVEAIIHVGGEATRYRRAGSGPPVLLLSAPDSAAALGALVFGALAGPLRVIAPEMPTADAADVAGAAGAAGAAAPTAGAGPCASPWLRRVVDGLALARTSVVADEAFATAALCLALCDPERVDRLVLVRRDADGGDWGEEAVADVLGGSRHPLLVLRVGPDGAPRAAGVAEALRRFLVPP